MKLVDISQNMKPIDIIDIRSRIRAGLITPYIRGGYVYLANDAGEVVSIGSVKELEERARENE